MRDFKTLNIWQDGMELVKAVYQIVELLPNDEKFGMRSQMTRAAISIPSNIAEGCSRDSQKDFKRFLEIALGSAFELETQILILIEISILKIDEIQLLLDNLTKLKKQINSLIQKLKANSQ
ncbi:MAG: four helix bundle protein [Bacteroidetes bacterium]|nr:four helix bundle protein [Bacteroidota bacterium]